MNLKNYSRIGFGTSRLHHFHSSDERIRLLSKAHEVGVRYFDTAPLYGHGLAEREIGKFLKILNCRSEIIIATKFGLMPNKIVERFPKLLMPFIASRKLIEKIGPRFSKYFRPKKDFSEKNLIQQVEVSLSRINSDYIDVMYLHEPELMDLNQLEGLKTATESLLRQGLVRQFGVSSDWLTAKWLHENTPEIALVLQIKAPSIESISSLKWINKNATVTYGHFQSIPMVPKDEYWLHRVAERAVHWNPLGTILFSTKNTDHLRSFVSAIDVADENMKSKNG